MDPVAVNALVPAALSALSGLRAVQALTTSVNPGDGLTRPRQDLTQGFFQQALLDAAIYPVAEPATKAPEQPAVPPAWAAPAPAPATPPPATLPAEPPAVADPVAAGASLEFALQTALRFGAGVAALAPPGLAPAGQGPGLVRDAAAVPRIRSLQPHAGGPGPEAFAHPHAPAQRLVLDYRAAPTVPGTGQVDLLA